MRRASLLAIVLSTSIAHAQPDPEALYKEGQAAYDAKNYDAALAAWKQSYELSKLPALLFNIAQAHRLRGDCSEAVARYREFIAADPQATERPDAEAFIKDLAPTCPPKKIDPVPDKGTKPIVKPPIVVGGGGSGGRGKRITAFVVGGAGVALVGVGAYFGNQASSIANEVKTDCADGCSWDLVKDRDAQGRSAETKQYIFLGAGGASLLAAGMLYWLGARDREQALTVTPRGDGATISWSRRW